MTAACHFSTGIKSKNSKSEIRLVQKIYSLLSQLKKKAAQGDEESEQDLFNFRDNITSEFQKHLSQTAKSGQPDYGPPIRVILEIADWAIPLLLWLTEHQRENVKKRARNRWTWPAYIHLSKREQNRYKKLLPKYNKTGTKIVEASPIELGSNLPFQFNANLTKCDYLFQVAASAIDYLVPPYDSSKFLHSRSWLWLPNHHKPLLKLNREAYAIEAANFLNSFGKFTRESFPKWKPVFESYLTFRHGLPEDKFELFPKEWQSNLDVCFRHGAEIQWFEIYKRKNRMTAAKEAECLADLQAKSKLYHASPPLQNVDLPEILKIVERKKSDHGQWNELKMELLKRIENLAPDS